MRRIAIVLTTRGNFGKMLSTMRAVRARPDLELKIVVGGGILHDSYGNFVPTVEAEGFRVDGTADYLDGNSDDLDSMTRSAGRAVEAFGNTLAALAPDIVVVIADRYEALSLALAATCRAIPIAHLEGGETSGSIDDRFRHAISKLAQIHLPATCGAAARLIAMGEAQDRVHVVGSPSIDVIASIRLDELAPLDDYQADHGTGATLDHRAPFLLVSQHPVVEEHADAESQIAETAAAVAEIGLPTLWVQPNMDAGAAGVRKAVGQFLDSGSGVPVRVYSSLPLQLYARAMNACACMVGNSSSGIREAAYLGVPVVNVGTRQRDRERGDNVIDVAYKRSELAAAIRIQIARGRLVSDPIYGDGKSGEKIAAILARTPLTLDKPATP